MQQSQSVAVMPCIKGFIQRMNQAAKTILELSEEGFEVIAADAQRGKMPTIQIRVCPACLSLIRSEVATYYKQGPAERVGQFTRNDCRVIWVERGN